MEGGVGFGLGAALWGNLVLENGRVQQSNFNDYRVLRMNEMPKVEVHIVPSAEAPTGVGEPGVAPIGPALANAIFSATGKRVSALPLSKSGLA
jgi:isoquinoline 1-oxidoreductase beta subunit